MQAPTRKTLSLECPEESTCLSKQRSGAEAGKKSVFNPKYTVSMAKDLILESFLTPTARQIYKNSVQVSAATFNVICSRPKLPRRTRSCSQSG